MTAESTPGSSGGASGATTVGNYFVANYPPFSCWTPEHVPSVRSAFEDTSVAEQPIGLYVHLPFCRKRCDFCYFKVYTDRSADEIHRYIDAVIAEAKAYSQLAGVGGRPLKFLYFGGGTPSYLSVRQLQTLFAGLREAFSWDDAEEITFECEPGTLQDSKIQALYDEGITRLSLGVENFDPDILEVNNRAHRAKEIYRAYEFARTVGFDQINLDLIAGMVGETDANWQHCIAETLRLRPESVTIYQMEVPYNTTIYRRVKDGEEVELPIADWTTKRRWTDEAFAALEAAGYEIGSAYTAKLRDRVSFLYRDALWHGSDMVALGVSSFGHYSHIHYQNEHRIEEYLDRVDRGELPIYRALPLSDEERLIREFVLQLKLGRLERQPFLDKFGVDVGERFREPLAAHQSRAMLEVFPDAIQLSREGLLQVDSLLHSFFLDEHRDVRYA